MRPLCSALLFCAPIFVLGAGELPLQSFITVERGVYKTGWEHDFFRDEPVAESAGETPDTLMTAPDDAAPITDRDTLPHRQNGRAVKHRDEQMAAEQPDDAAPSEQIAAPPTEEKIPPPEERRPVPPRPAAVKSVPARPQEVEQRHETVLQEESAEPKKKQKERARELEKKRKKGNFRDPKIAY